MQYIRQYIYHEIFLFQQLDWKVQRFLLSIVLYETVKPVFSFFINTYLWRQSPTFEPIILYNLGVFCTAFIGIYINNALLKKCSISVLYTAGLIGLVITTVILFLVPITNSTSFLLGCLFGLPMGMYWGNRHLIKQTLTNDANRNFISGLEIFLAAPSIITPVIIGWIIASGEISGWYSSLDAYWLVLILTTILLLCSSWVFRSVQLPTPRTHSLFILNVSREWNLMRLAKLFEGMQGGITIVMPTIMILYALGSEGKVGTIMTAATLGATILVYQLSKKMLPHHRGTIIILSAFLLIASSLGMASNLNTLLILVNIFTIQIAGKFIMASFGPVFMEVIDHQDDGDDSNNVAYIADSEFWINVGRGITLLIVLLILNLGESFALRFSAVLSALSFVGFILVVRVMTQTKIRQAFNFALLKALKAIKLSFN